MKEVLLSLFIFMFINSLWAAEQEGTDLSVKAIRLSEPVQLDGYLKEKVWQNGEGISTFTQRDPIEGAQPSEKTEVHVAYDDEAIYIAARMYDTNPDSIIARLGRRDAFIQSDMFGFFLDPYHDKRSGYYFGINAAGTLYDGVLLNDEWDDDSWDGVWDGEVQIDNQCWTAEFRVPFSQLRFKNEENYVWGINFRRDIARKNEILYLVYTPKNGSGFVSRFPDLLGIKNINPSKRYEILPYFRTKAEFKHPEEGDPFNSGSEFTPGIGGDFRIGLSSNLILNGTINPDFGQVEVDPAVVNLSDVETFYSEKRPFFIEGSSIFRFGQGGSRSNWSFNWGSPRFFHSRRIGSSPHGSLPDYDYSDVPNGTRIIGAAKLSGKVGDNWNIGFINALTAREFAQIEYEGQRSKVEVEPLANYSIMRLQKEIDDGFQGIGMIGTGTIRNFEDDRLRDELNSQAYSFGLDGWTFLDKDREWVVTSWGGMTHVRGNESRMLSLQTNSRHYFQRPDAKSVSVDSSATSLQGYAARVLVNKQKGNVIFNSALGVISPGFDVNDVGFMWRTNVINAHLGSGYKWTEPGKVFRYAEVIGAIFYNSDFDGNTTWAGIWGMTFMRFLNYYMMGINTAYNPETTNLYRTRGGPITTSPPGYQLNMWAESDNRKDFVFGIDAGTYYRSDKDKNIDLGFEIEWKPTSNLSLSFNPQIEWNDAFSQWVDVFDDPTANRTYGSRYVFAEMQQTTFAASFRLSWTFTPKLSLQLYAQPLISSGNYTDFKELDRPKSYDFNVYGTGNSTIEYFLDKEEDQWKYRAFPDGPGGEAAEIIFNDPNFNIKSLLGNAVLRWEYMPGSTLYFVWTQNRFNYENIGEFQFRESLGQLAAAEADNIFMVKLTYWWNF